jgi:hypothetical protein
MADQLASEIRASLSGGASSLDGAALIAALGGRDNVASSEARAGRVLVTVRDAACVQREALVAAGLRDAALVGDRSVHLLHEDADRLATELAAAR